MIAESAVQIPRNHKPLARAVAVIDQEMVLVETIPVLDENRGGQVIDVFVQVHSAREEVERVGCGREFVAEQLEFAQAVGFRRFVRRSETGVVVSGFVLGC